MSTLLTAGTSKTIRVNDVKFTKTVVTLPTVWAEAGLAFTPANLGFKNKVLYVFPIFKSGYIFNAVASAEANTGNLDTLLAYRDAGSAATGVAAAALAAVSDSVDLSTTPGTINVFAVGV